MNTPVTTSSMGRRGRAIALAGAGGSHPAMLRAVAAALRRSYPGTPVVVFDLSAFDTRGGADYDEEPPVFRLTPRDIGMRQWFRTAAPNLVLAGGVRPYGRMLAAFAEALRARDVGALLLSHSRGFPEQALLTAARDLGIAVAQIDEGPFSIPFRPRNQPEAPQPLVRLGLRMLRLARLLPPRDLSGDKVDLYLSTAPGRGRIMLARGLEEARLAVIPGPRFDDLSVLAGRWPDRPKDQDFARILWVHQPFRRDGKVASDAADRALEVLIEGLLGAAKARPIRVRMRMHPRSDAAERQRIAAAFARLGDAAAFSEEPVFYEDMMHTDLLTGFYSSTLLEAAAIGAPTLAVRIDPRAFKSRWEAEKMQLMADYGVPLVSDSATFETTLFNLLDAGMVPPAPALGDAHIGQLGGGAQAAADALITLRDRFSS